MSVINTNITSMIGQQNLRESQNSLQTSMERLSSGLRINSAKDDAAGQAIANRFSSQVTGLAQAQRNANDGISIAQTAEGGLDQVNDNLQRIRELTVQAANGTNSESDLNSIQDEVDQRLSEINRISRETDFNNTRVLAEGSESINIQVGANDGQTIELNLSEVTSSSLGLEGFNVNGAGEIDNAAATKDDLTRLGFTSRGTTNGIELFDNDVDNDSLTVKDALGSLQDGDTFTTNATVSGLGVAPDGDVTFNADDNNFSFNAEDASFADIASQLTPSGAGETNTVTIDIQAGGGEQEVVIDSDGLLTSADTGQELFLTADGNLSQTNSTGALPQADIESVLESMGAPDVGTANAPNVSATGFDTSGSAPVLELDFSTLAGGQLEEGQSVTVDGVTLTATDGAIAQDQVAEAFLAKLNNGDVETVSGGGEFSGTFDSGLNLSGFAGTSGVSGGVLTLTADATGNGTAEFGTTNTTFDSAGDGPAAGTGGTIESGDTTFTADTTNSTIDVTGFTLGADEMENLLKGDNFDNGDNYTFAANGVSSNGYIDAESGDLTTAATTTVERFVQDNGVVTDGAARQVFVDQDNELTFEDVTASERSSIEDLDKAIAQVDSFRSDLGAVQNRFESAITNLSTNQTNLADARSRIEDADYAMEVADMTRAQILQQAGTSVLAQANQLPQNVLSLLG